MPLSKNQSTNIFALMAQQYPKEVTLYLTFENVNIKDKYS